MHLIEGMERGLTESHQRFGPSSRSSVVEKVHGYDAEWVRLTRLEDLVSYDASHSDVAPVVQLPGRERDVSRVDDPVRRTARLLVTGPLQVEIDQPRTRGGDLDRKQRSRRQVALGQVSASGHQQIRLYHGVLGEHDVRGASSTRSAGGHDARSSTYSSPTINWCRGTDAGVTINVPSMSS